MCDVSIITAGDAGQGVESGSAGFALAAARAGFHVFGAPDFRSRIRGGHNFFQVRMSHSPVYSHTRRSHVLLALAPGSIEAHLDDLVEGAAVIYPDSFRVDPTLIEGRGLLPVALPLTALAEEHGSRLMVNTAALGAAAGILDFPFEAMATVIRKNFMRKGPGVVGANLRVAEAACDLARGRYGGDFQYRVSAPPEAPERLLLNGNQALAFGALAGGCRFVSAYPMTPATSIVEWLAAAPREYGLVSKHTEDEIAAVCMAIGASFAGARAMTATSGGGFCLMVEAMGLAGMIEVPVVIVNAQRGGPSTGLPTRTEQSDLLFAIHAGQGEFPRIVLAPATHEECFEAGWRAFNLAEVYQCPVVVMTDSYLATALRTVDAGAIDPHAVRIDRGHTLDHDELERSIDGYRRFQLTPSGVSPRAIPGHPNAIFPVPSDEHDETGHITEDGANRVAMMQKRMRKLETAEREMRGPELYGPLQAEVTLLTWGSTYGPCRQAVDIINERGGRANLLSFGDLWPLPREAAENALRACRRTVAVEQNFTSQLGALLRMTTGIAPDETLTKYDGRPLNPDEIAAGVYERIDVGTKA